MIKNLKNGAKSDLEIRKLTEDQFEIGKYVNGLTDFIKTCETPLTISIQGDWGSGKTSIMRMIQNQLVDEDESGKLHTPVMTVWINTWQYSQFDLGDNLPFIILTKVIKSLNIKSSSVSDFFSDLVDFLSIMNLGKVSATTKALKEITTKNSIDSISSLRDKFETYVKNATDVFYDSKDDNEKRIVFFIDDLDRLEPKRAVEILEVLKLFLESKRCIFVLAIDYEVVVEGVNQKYKGALSEAKGRSFFDKIIQLPFKMPVSHYDTKKYLKNILSRLDIEDEDIQIYLNLLRYSLGHNPRTIKRIFNSFELLRIINSEINSDIKNRNKYERVLFAILCLQMSYEKLYNYIVVHGDDENTKELFKKIYNLNSDMDHSEVNDGVIKETPIDILLGWLKERELLSESDRPNFITSFLSELLNVVIIENEQDSSEEIDTQYLFEILQSTTVFNIVDDSSIKTKSNKGNRFKYGYDDPAFVTVDRNLKKEVGSHGWNNSIILGYKIHNEDVIIVDSYNELLDKFLNGLYDKYGKDFEMMVNNHDMDKKLKLLFSGAIAGGGFASPKTIKNTDICYETKSETNKKIQDIKTIMNIFNIPISDLELKIKIARKIV